MNNLCLYAMVFDKPIQDKRALVSTLKHHACKSIRQGPTEHSIEFRLDSSTWNMDDWRNWSILMADCQFNPGNSCLPKYTA
jgi:hypothetical protein